MLTDAEILVLKLVLERRLIDEQTATRCLMAIYSSGGQRRLSETLQAEGSIAPMVAARIGALAIRARRSRGAVIVSRRELADEALAKLLGQERRLTAAQFEQARAGQRQLERSGRLWSLAQVLAQRGLLPGAELPRYEARVLARLATCAGCYRHYLTPQRLERSRYPCRHCRGTIYVGALPDEAYASFLEPEHLTGPVATAAPKAQEAPPHSAAVAAAPIERRSPEDQSNRAGAALLTGRFQALPKIESTRRATRSAVTPQHDQADQELTVALTMIRRGEEVEAPPEGSRFGRFVVLEELARGGMGVVYKARLDRRLIALKVLLAGDEAGEVERKRFEREARLADELAHPGIVAKVEAGQVDGFDYIAFEYIAGRSLEQQLIDGPLDPKIAASLLATVAESMHHAHGKDVVHRDLKPQNLMIEDGTGAAKVLDFGVARSLRDDMRFTQTGTSVGTPFYMAPEQVRGEGEQGPGCDIYALGAILYECLTGRVPFQAENPMQLYHLIAEVAPKPPSAHVARLSPVIETICLCAMAKRVEDRYQSAGAMAQDLKAFLAGRPVLGRRPDAVAQRARRALRRPLTIVALALLLAALIVLLALR